MGWQPPKNPERPVNVDDVELRQALDVLVRRMAAARRPLQHLWTLQASNGAAVRIRITTEALPDGIE